ncbi:MAG TPA: glutamyl-tRNA reductase [Fimbriiglobus sp.]|jgi:glutamyl-tRNA reductase
MNLRAIGCNFRTAPVALREKLAIEGKALDEATAGLAARFEAEVVVLSTCNRVEVYLAKPAGDAPVEPAAIAEALGEWAGLSSGDILKVLYVHSDEAAVRHVCRVAASLDSLVVGEGQIAGQVKKAYDAAGRLGTAGPFLHTLMPFALKTAKKIRTDTGIAKGHVSVPSVAVDYVRQVFDHFSDKTVLVIGAGKMGRLTLTHLKDLRPKQILVTNRSSEKAEETAAACGGRAIPWVDLDAALARADIVLSTTGAPVPVVGKSRFDAAVRPFRTGGPLVVLDIAVPRDFDPALHDGDRVVVVNVDDLARVRDETLAERRRHLAPAEAIVDHAVRAFAADWARRKSGPVIRKLTAEFDRVREGVTGPLLTRFNGKLTPEEKQAVEYAFRLFQNQLLHGPIAALHESSAEAGHGTLLDALKKMFRLGE